MPSNSPTNDASGTLYIVGTPIGNMEDITLRAIHILKTVDLIAAEDTRNTGKLLAYHQIKNKLVSFHEHNERERTKQLIDKLENGYSIALVSDAGTPSVSDPGYRLVKETTEKNLAVIPIPGASAAIAALCASGLPTDTFIFVGFLPKKKGARQTQLKGLACQNRTMLFYESPKRIIPFIEEAILSFGDRPGVLCREMTKPYEEFIRGNLSDIQNKLREKDSIKGECTLVISGRAIDEKLSIETIRQEIKQKMENTKKSTSFIAKEIALDLNLPKKSVYNEILRIKEEGEKE